MDAMVNVCLGLHRSTDPTKEPLLIIIDKKVLTRGLFNYWSNARINIVLFSNNIPIIEKGAGLSSETLLDAALCDATPLDEIDLNL